MLGGRDYAAALVPLLDDSQKCGLQIVRLGQQPIVVQLRDVAAAWLIKVTGQELSFLPERRACNDPSIASHSSEVSSGPDASCGNRTADGSLKTLDPTELGSF